MSRSCLFLASTSLLATLAAGACKQTPAPTGAVGSGEPGDAVPAATAPASNPPAAIVKSPGPVRLDARLGCENPGRGKDVCEFDPKGEILPMLAPGARLWLAAGVSPEADLLVIGRSSQGVYQVLARWSRVGLARDGGDGHHPEARPIAAGREPPTTVLVIAHAVPLPALAQVDAVDCGDPARWANPAACEAIRRLEALLPPRPRCCVPPDLGSVMADRRPVEAVRVSGAGDGLAVVEVQFRASTTVR